ncbi:MAG: aspartate 1-decarboxylase [Elusimicrobiota bacterium]|nr:aspartate 1-decarboxylase [Endomicrobiia bacterium]MCX7641013.1 aspartate 1-decarboxylase [Elusimicrobiales bacterium]MDW8165541.1 aspartate 1-decarboxylase [Elusimicrobiota bacterium]
MLVKYLKSKLQGLVVTEKNLNYSGSIALDIDFLEKAKIKPYEVVLVVNLNNAERFETYVIPAKKGSKTVSLQGGAARLGEVGDSLIVMSFCYLQSDEEIKPISIIFDKNNKIKKIIK